MRSPINSTVLRDLHTWQEHGTGRGAAAAAVPTEEPNFNASDRRLWRAAGAGIDDKGHQQAGSTQDVGKTAGGLLKPKPEAPTSDRKSVV